MKIRAFTLAEMLVACGLLMLVSSCGLWTLRTSSLLFQSSVHRTQWNRDFLLATGQLRGWLEEASLTSLRLREQGSSTLSCAFATARDWDGNFHTDADGRPEWQAYQVLLHEADQLRWLRIPLNQPEPLLPIGTSSRCLLRGLKTFQLLVQDNQLSLQLSAGSPDGLSSAVWQTRILTR